MNDYTFRTSNLLPLSVGFDRPFKALEALAGVKTPSYPPYNIVKTGEDQYLIEIAVAGFNTEDEFNISVQDNVLVIAGSKNEPSAEYLYHGIATRDFKREFTLASTIVVDKATLKDGILSIELRNVIPESMKPRQIPVEIA